MSPKLRVWDWQAVLFTVSLYSTSIFVRFSVVWTLRVYSASQKIGSGATEEGLI